MSDHFWQMSEQILPCADMCLSTFSPYFMLWYMGYNILCMTYVRN